MTDPPDEQRKRSKPIIGLVGGIGAGKSTVARIMESLGAAVIDSDRLAHQELQTPEVVAALRSWWGDKIFRSPNEIDRRKIAEIVFHHPRELARLEGLLYPRIHRVREVLAAGLESDPGVRAIVLDVPKLYEAGLGDYCDAVVFVDADWSARHRRVEANKGWSGEELRRRENLQIPLDDKKAKADYVVANQSDTNVLGRDVERVFFEILASFSQRAA